MPTALITFTLEAQRKENKPPAEAIYEAGPGGKAERYVPRPYFLASFFRVVAPRLTRSVLGGKGSQRLSTKTGAD